MPAGSAGSGENQWTHRLRSTSGAVGAGVGLLASLLSIIFLVWPSLQPEENAVVLAASLSNPTIERQVSLAEFYQRTRETPDPALSDAGLLTPGVVVGYDVAISGYNGEVLTLRWSMIDAGTLTRVTEDWLVDQPGWPDAGFKAEAAEDSATGELWASLPATAGDYLVRLELFDPDGIRLSLVDTTAFSVDASQAPIPAEEPLIQPAPPVATASSSSLPPAPLVATAVTTP